MGHLYDVAINVWSPLSFQLNKCIWNCTLNQADVVVDIWSKTATKIGPPGSIWRGRVSPKFKFVENLWHIRFYQFAAELTRGWHHWVRGPDYATERVCHNCYTKLLASSTFLAFWIRMPCLYWQVAAWCCGRTWLDEYPCIDLGNILIELWLADPELGHEDDWIICLFQWQVGFRHCKY